MDEVVGGLDQIVPVSAPVDIFEEEKTVVIEDVRSIQVTDLEPRKESPEEGSVDTVTLEQPAESATEMRVGWTVVTRRLRTWGSQASLALGEGRRQVMQVMGKLRPAFVKRPAINFDSARVRTAGITIGSLLLFGVVGWSVVGVPERDLAPIPTVAPKLPIDTVEIENGLLVVDSQPWGEVRRVVSAKGTEVELPLNPYTPFPLELEPGEYTVETYRPDLDLVDTCVVVIESSGMSRCEPLLAALETDEFFKEIGWWQ